jgi:Fe2+ or Zn2+ uptake regulation protein
MTISREAGFIVFQCDGKRCAEIFESEEKQFEPALEFFKDESGWAMRKIKDEWFHVCPDCLEKEHGLVL